MCRSVSLVLFCLVSSVMIVSSAVIVTPAPTTSHRKLIVMSSDNEEQLLAEIVVQSPPLLVKGPPKGFPLVRHQRDVTENNISNLTMTSVSVNDRKTEIKLKKGKKKKGGLMKNMSPYMFIPALISLGMAPFFLANLQTFVMNALMINVMAFNAAIFLTLRNMVFGPRHGEHITYYNFGYKTKRPKHPHYHHPGKGS